MRNSGFVTVGSPLLLSLLLSLVSSLAGCGDEGKVCGRNTSAVGNECLPAVEVCGEGTYAVDGTCRPFDPNDNVPPVTSLQPSQIVFRQPQVDMRLVTEPGARIYYTSDGSEPSLDSASEAENLLLPRLDLPVNLRFFAVDSVGNQEAPRSVQLTQDNQGPAAVENLQIEDLGNGQVGLSWDNPSDIDFAGVAVIRSGEAVTVRAGQEVSAADAVFVGVETQVVDSPGEGTITYSVVSFDEVFNYGGIRQVSIELSPELSSSTGWELTTAGAVTTGGASSGVTFSVVFESASDFRVEVTNNTSTTFHAPKVLFEALSGATLVADGVLTAQPFVRVGEGGASLAPGETLSRQFSVLFDGDTASFNLRFRNDPILIVGDERKELRPVFVVDTATFETIATMSADNHVTATNDGGRAGFQGFVSRPGDRFVWAGNRSAGRVRKIDTTTWSTVAVGSIGEDYNTVGQPAFGPFGLLWAPLSTSGPGNQDSGRVGSTTDNYLVAIDADTMEEVRRVHVGNGSRLRDMRYSEAMGSFVVTSHIGSRLSLVDVAKPEDEAFSAITTPNITATRSLTLSDDGSVAFVASNVGRNHGRTEGDMSTIDMVAGTVVISNRLTHTVMASTRDSEGNIWFGNNETLSIFNPDTLEVEIVADRPGRGMIAVGSRVYQIAEDFVREVDAASRVILNETFLDTGEIFGHAIAFVP